MFNQDPMHYLHVQERVLRRDLDGTYGLKKYLHNNHPETSDQYRHLAQTMSNQGRLPDAAAFLTLAWEGRKATLGENHPLTQRSLRELADVQKRCGCHEASLEMLHNNDCHGYSTRHTTTSREHAVKMHILETELKAGSRLSPLNCELASTIKPGRSLSDSSLFFKKGVAVPRKRPVSQGCVSASSEAAHRKGRRLTPEEEEAILRDFAVVLLTRYPNVQDAFRAFDINGNGTLSGTEFAHYAKYFFDGDAQATFKALDINKGGDISIEEFKILGKMYKEHRKMLREVKKPKGEKAHIRVDGLGNIVCKTISTG